MQVTDKTTEQKINILKMVKTTTVVVIVVESDCIHNMTVLLFIQHITTLLIVGLIEREIYMTTNCC